MAIPAGGEEPQPLGYVDQDQEPADWCIILWAFPDSVNVYTPLTEAEAIRYGEYFKKQYPGVTSVMVRTKDIHTALLDLPIPGDKS